MVETRTIRDVELIKVGAFDISNGIFNVTTDLLRSVVDAHNAGVLPRKPVLKVGHTDGRFAGDGEPALGFVDNLRLTDNGNTVLGDYVNVPASVASILNHAWPDRSGEWDLNFRDESGRKWPCVLTAVALLGATGPGIRTIKSLQDVQALYEGVPAAAASAGVTSHRLLHGDSPVGQPRIDRTLILAAARRRRTHRK